MSFQTTAYSTLRLSLEDGILTVTLDRPEVLHALNAAMFDELEAVFRAVRESAEVRVALITGAGDRAFAAGADIRGLASTDDVSGRALSRRGHAVFEQIERCGKPVIACIHGVALGGGCELALACTLRLGSEKARLGLPEARLGLIPGYGGTQRLPRLIGTSAALRLMLTGEFVPAAEALRLGLLDEVLAPEELMPRARALAATIASMAPLAIEATLEAVYGGRDLSLDEALSLESDIFGRLSATEDKREGVDAFLNKRTPSWRGR